MVGGGGVPPVCGFTADNRDKWATTRAALWAASEDNRRSLESIDTALCCMVLDDTSVKRLLCTRVRNLVGVLGVLGVLGVFHFRCIC